MKTHLGTRIGEKTPEEESKWHQNAKEHSESKGQFGTFGVPFGTPKGLNFLPMGFGRTAFGTPKVPNFLPMGFGPTAFG